MGCPAHRPLISEGEGVYRPSPFARVKSWLRWLEAEESYGVDAAFLRRVRSPRLDTEQPDPFTEEEVDRLFRACRSNTGTGQRMRTLLALLLDTAIRESELCDLRLAAEMLVAALRHCRRREDVFDAAIVLEEWAQLAVSFGQLSD